MPSEIIQAKVPIKVWTKVASVESEAIEQLKRVAALPWAFSHVAVMPDVHSGRGCTVGSVIAMRDAIAPAAVGVDIGCGMVAGRTNLDADKVRRRAKQVRNLIEERVPVGFNSHATPVSLEGDLRASGDSLFERFGDLDPHAHGLLQRALGQVGTLGGGNHFIEVCVDTDDNVWLMLHSGSRNIGKELAEVHISKAMWLSHNRELPDRELAVFLAGTEEMARYRHDLFWAQQYALLNREVMMELCMQALAELWPSVTFEEAPVQCHHNYVAEEVHFGEQVLVTRKGAINAERGRMGIIPGSMGAKSFIVRGLGNPESFNSASHGAGRKMSRGAAKRKYTRKDLEFQTRGIECRKDADVLDEIPSAYKDIDRVMADQSDLVEIVAELRQIICVKG